ncbi:ABC transporter ATP-binding protein [Corynebacterium sp. sy017]|uniref:ABC transporter ATP-binding protein n=1 Tax=unclassified Corynebacterium TaxID=2624378 RepID=UPI001185A164|nr:MULTISPECIES: ABC transporter ATP-binding protein [unclassified Corynebacterium]MBP3089147.1 ABC transporter ATP-binding protein [Corynebacterium sp. sy017]QDZ42502.1 ABC transporter ATP-binding protein [Corynebacterium sp. sy039]TSD91459.1 ABC transporter ATP-binding protein [Corynebacterium sp. SY003]
MSQTLQLHELTKEFGGGPVLSGISLTINAGESVAIMGPSGSGKSTLLHCMSGILVPSSGSITFGDTQIGTMTDKQRSKIRLHNFGFVFQDGQLLPELSNMENVALPAMLAGVSRNKAKQHAQHLLDQLGIGNLAQRRPGQISGGQAQRVAIARALVTQPAIIFADEPTGALDQSTGHEVMQLLTTMTKTTGSTLIMVTHDANVAQWLDRLVEIRDGIIHSDRRLTQRTVRQEN